MYQCAHCKNEADNVYRFVVVNSMVSSESKDYIVAKRTTTTVYEKFETVERVGICNNCIKKERNMFALKGVGATFFCVLCLLVVARAFTPGFLITFGIIALGVSIGIFIYSRTRKDAFYASGIRRAMSSNRFHYVPVDISLYCSGGNSTPTIRTFKDKTNLRTGLADKIFEKFVLSGNGDALIDSMLASNGVPEKAMTEDLKPSTSSING